MAVRSIAEEKPSWFENALPGRAGFFTKSSLRNKLIT